MRRFHSSRILLVLLLATTLGAPPVWGEPARHEVTSAFSQIWDLIIELWGTAGCILDPHGSCAAGADVSLREAGCGIDPHDCPGSQNAPAVDEGCGIDPHGGCSH